MVKRWLALLFLVLTAANAYAVEEICGDGLDNDSSGGDLPCPEPDKDLDGYTTDGTGLGYDCDDNSMFMPAQPWTRDGCSGLQAKKCNTATGSYGACTTPTEGATNYYIDATSGNDANACSFASPCLTFLKFSQYISASPPGGYIDLAAGRTVWVFNGTLDETYTDGSTVRPSIYTRRSGSSGSPIRIWAPLSSNAPSVVVDPAACDGTPYCPAMSFIANNYVDVRGFVIQGGFHEGTVDGVEGAGISTDGDNHVFSANWVKNNEGPNGSNPCGISIADSPSNVSVDHNRVNDNYDRTASKNVNEKQICGYTGTGNSVTYNVVYNTAAKTDANDAAGCIWWKHGQDSASNTIAYNRMWNCWDSSIGTMNSGTWIHHNLIVDSDPIWPFYDWAGSYYVKGNIIEYNTLKNTRAYRIDPDLVSGTPTANTYRYNVVNDNSGSYSGETSFITIHPYGTNANYTTWYTGGLYSINNNCYYNSAATALSFNLYASGESSGNTYNWTTWRSTAGFDASSFNENPTLDSYHRATSTNCKNWGWLQAPAAGGSGRPKWSCMFFGVC